jgi:hypothetical protein
MSPRVGNGSAEGDWGVVGKGTYMGGCMGASSMGAGHQGGARLLEGLLEGDDHGSKQIDKWFARYRDHAAFG